MNQRAKANPSPLFKLNPKLKFTMLMLAIIMGTFLVPINSTMIAVGLPSIATAFQENITGITWLVTIYLIVMAVAQPIAGKLGDLYGHRRMFLIGVFLFFLFSIACAYSFTLLSLIIFRCLQALGAALAFPNATAILRISMPREKLVKVLGLFGMAMGIGAAIGPVMGSFLIHYFGWKSIFWVNAPILTLSFLFAYITFPKHHQGRVHSLDYLGSIYLAGTFVTFILLVTRGLDHVWMVPLFLLFLILFIYQELKTKEPLIQFSLFRNKRFTVSNISILLSNLIMYSTVLVIPILLEEKGFDIRHIGFVLFIFSLSMSIFSYVGGHLSVKQRKISIISLSFLVSSLALILYMINTESLLLLSLFLFIGGAGSGIGLPSMQTSNLESVSKGNVGVASGIYSTFRYFGGMGASVIVGLFHSNSLFFLILLGVSILGFVLSRENKMNVLKVT